MWESQVLLTDGQVVFLRVLRFSPTFDERSARYKWNILERAVKPKSKKKKKKKKYYRGGPHFGGCSTNGYTIHSMSTRHWALVTGHPGNGHWLVNTPSTSHRALVNQAPGMSHWAPVIRLLTCSTIISNQSPGTNHHAPGTRQQMLSTEYRVADFRYPWPQSNQLRMSLRTQWINKECLGNMPDPSIIIEHLTKTWKTNRSVFLLKYIPQEINLNIIIKRREDTILLLLIFLIFFFLSNGTESQRSQNNYKKRRRWSPSSFSFEY